MVSLELYLGRLRDNRIEVIRKVLNWLTEG
jgi:hypothetical protein